MRLPLLGSLIALGLSSLASEARAQVPFSNVNDPFFAYYSFYLPRQQAQANSPGPEATINALSANRQQYAATNRNDMFDPSATGRDLFGSDAGEFNPNSGQIKRSLSAGASRIGGNLNGLGPQGYYNTRSLARYYPNLRAGRGKNANVSVVRNRGFSGGGIGGGGNLGLPGPR